MRASTTTVLLGQIAAHLSLIPMIAYGLWWQWLIAVAVFYIAGLVGGTMNYHRLLAHRSWKAPKGFETVATLLETVMLVGSSIAWVATHREHHRNADKEADPHSPHRVGFFRAHFLSMLHKPKPKYAVDLIRSRFHLFIHEYYWGINFAYAGILFLIDPMAILYAWLVPGCLIWNAGSAINSFGHCFGKQPNLTGDEARNNPILGYLFWGEGWHNNHHSDSKQYRFGRYDGQFDIAAVLIDLIRIK